MKKATLIAAVLASLALLAGCVHPNDVGSIAPTASSGLPAVSQA
jgi:outer membrane murein-binding lipoprotein Lpp